MKHFCGYSNYIDQKAFIAQELYLVFNQQFKSTFHGLIGAVVCNFQKKSGHVGSGMLISPDLVLTAAHNILGQMNQKAYDNFKFYLGNTNGDSRDVYQIQSYAFPSQFLSSSMKSKKFFYNYALLKLSKKVQREKYIQMSSPCPKCLIAKNLQYSLQVYGYPLIKDNYKPLDQTGKLFILRQYGLSQKNRITNISQDISRIQYFIATKPGNSGSPLIINEQLIGIHLGSAIGEEKGNFGRLIQKSMISNLLAWQQKLKSCQFKIKFQSSLCPHFQNNNKKKNIQNVNFKEMSEDSTQYTNETGVFSLEQKNQILTYKFQPINKFKKSKSLKLLEERWKQLFKAQNKSLQFNKGIFQSQQSFLNLVSQQQFKLKHIDMIEFVKIKLPNLIQLYLQNNRIRDDGLEILSKGLFPKLKKISLDDNQITINGLKYILYNKWNQDVDYQLYSVQSNDFGFYLNIGSRIPMMKKILGPHGMRNYANWITENKQKVLQATKLLLLTPLDKFSNQKQRYLLSDKIQQKYIKSIKQQPLSLANVMLQLKKRFGSNLIFTNSSSIKSKLTSKVLFTGILQSRITLNKKIQTDSNFSFSYFKSNSAQLKNFQQWLLNFLAQKYNIKSITLSLDKVTKGSIDAEISDNNHTESSLYLTKLKPQSMKLYFQNLELTEDEFDEQGDYDFPEIQYAQNQERGGFPYYQPVLGKRFGIRVSGLYENDKWLSMNGDKDQWAIAFHGVTFPTADSKIRSIMNGRLAGNMLRPGYGQVHSADICLKTGQLVGEGIYVSPYFLTCLLSYAEKQQASLYHLVLQCRANPTKIKITDQSDYWVIT